MTFVRRFTFASLLCAAALALVPIASVAARPKPHAGRPAGAEGSYKGYIAIDAATGRTLAEDHADEVSPPASMTKLMTFAVLHDKLVAGTLALDTPVRITNDDARMGGTQVYLDPRETFPVEDLIYAMMIQSANDAAHALARASAGSVEAFVELMNAKAREIGMTHTTFRSPHGLPPSSRRIADGDLTTPRDYAILCRYLLKNTDVLKYTSVRTRVFGEGHRAPDKLIRMVNHDHLLGKIAGVDGLKTGYTEGAGYCLSSTAERNGHRVIVVIMGSFGPGGQRDLGRWRDRKAIELIERGFAAIPPGSAPFVAAPTAAPATPANVSPITQAPMPADEKAAAEAADTPPPTIKFSIPKMKP